MNPYNDMDEDMEEEDMTLFDEDDSPSKLLIYGIKAFDMFQTTLKYLWLPTIILVGVNVTKTSLLSTINPFSEVSPDQEERA